MGAQPRLTLRPLVATDADAGRGLATVALRLLVAQAFEQGLQRVWLEIHPWNRASFRVAEKYGFRYEGERGDMAFTP